MTSTASPKSRACWRPFWPVVASRTSSVSCGAPSSRLRDHAPNLAELVHQVRLRVQAAGGVDEDDVAAPALRGGDRIEGDRGGIGALRRADEVRPRALGPDLELLVGRGAERVGGADEDRTAVRREPVGELADRRRLARAVHADDEHDTRVLVDRQRGRLAEQRRDLLDQGVGEIVDVAALAQSLDQLVRRGHAHVGGDERVLEGLPGLVVAGVEAAERQADDVAGAAERAPQPPEEAPALGIRLGDLMLVAEQL